MVCLVREGQGEEEGKKERSFIHMGDISREGSPVHGWIDSFTGGARDGRTDREGKEILPHMMHVWMDIDGKYINRDIGS